MRSYQTLAELRKELSDDSGMVLISETSELLRYSRDAYDYSPILAKLLNDCCADLVVNPINISAVERLASACARHKVPLTIRGSGTGNYGQCVPLEGGVVMLTNNLQKILRLDPITGVIVVEPGCQLRNLDQFLRSHGRQLRLMPSSWRSASIGGFISGGSGGIGSIKWGFLRDPGHLVGLEIVTVENNPRRLKLKSNTAQALNHAYGTNGIITSLELATAPAIDLEQIVIDCYSWDKSVELLLSISHAAFDLQLATLIERHILEKLPKWSGPSADCHRLLLLAAPDVKEFVRCMAANAGAFFKDLGTEDLNRRNSLRELSWNHTTLHMRASNPQWTYLQMLLPQPELPVMKTLSQRWGNEILWHLEAVRHQGSIRLAALPLVQWKKEEGMKRLIAECRDLGIMIFNPHVMTVEDGGLGLVDVDQVAAKKNYDPNGLLNPGKLRGWFSK